MQVRKDRLLSETAAARCKGRTLRSSQTNWSASASRPVWTRGAPLDGVTHTGPRPQRNCTQPRVAALGRVVDRREALAVPLVHVGARVDQRLEARGVGPDDPSSALDFFER